MVDKIKKHQRALLGVLIIICMGVILVGGLYYVETLKKNLQSSAIQNVMTVTKQQQQAFDNFIEGDRNRLHSYANYFSTNEHNDAEEVQHVLTLFKEVDATCSVVCLDDGWFCSNTSNTIHQLAEEDLNIYRGLTGSGIRDSFYGIVSGAPRFGYYESFTFTNGHKGLIQKSYDRTKVSEVFSLSFYNDQGFAYVVNQRGDILLRSVGMIDDQLYQNIFDILTGTIGTQKDIDQFAQALQEEEEGSITFTGDMGSYVYTYVPVVNVEDWYLVSVVPMEAITAETSRMLHNSQMTFAILGLILSLCAIFIVLIWRTHKEIEAKDEEVK